MSDNKFKNAFSFLRSRLGNIRLPSNQIDNAEPTPYKSTSTLSPSPPESMLWKVYEEKVEQFKATQTSTASGMIELDRYMQEPLIDRHEDLLKWYIYPHLHTFVIKRLCVTATSVPCERDIFRSRQDYYFKEKPLEYKKSITTYIPA